MEPNLDEKRKPEMSQGIYCPYRKAIYIAVLIAICISVTLFYLGVYCLYVSVSVTHYSPSAMEGDLKPPVTEVQ